ncbi:S-layer homology domain-containing protein [Lysinibacillus sp. 54212]|uniref:S-layer homology domain-containing protein n=1 Tax=Lysinibacillus sp. 54212 TaxID=3119829 RepID=UPI002FCB2CFC
MRNKFIKYFLVSSALLFGMNISDSANAAVDFSDIDGSYARDEIQELAALGILNGTGNGKFNPTANITRQDFAIIMAKALNLDSSNQPATPTFSDVPQGHYAFPAIEGAVKAGLISGMGDGTFGTGENLTREQMVAIFVRALRRDTTGMGANLPFSDAGSISDWARNYVGAAVGLGLLNGNGNGTFNPGASAERQAAALVASKFLKAKDNLTPVEPNPEPQPEPGPVEPNPEPQPEPGPVEPNPDPVEPEPQPDEGKEPEIPNPDHPNPEIPEPDKPKEEIRNY